MTSLLGQPSHCASQDRNTVGFTRPHVLSQFFLGAVGEPETRDIACCGIPTAGAPTTNTMVGGGIPEGLHMVGEGRGQECHSLLEIPVDVQCAESSQYLLSGAILTHILTHNSRTPVNIDCSVLLVVPKLHTSCQHAPSRSVGSALGVSVDRLCDHIAAPDSQKACHVIRLAVRLRPSLFFAHSPPRGPAHPNL